MAGQMEEMQFREEGGERGESVHVIYGDVSAVDRIRRKLRKGGRS